MCAPLQWAVACPPLLRRPPELLLGADRYGPEVDMWSVGCILAELLVRTAAPASHMGLKTLTFIVILAEHLAELLVSLAARLAAPCVTPWAPPWTDPWTPWVGPRPKPLYMRLDDCMESYRVPGGRY